MKILHISYSDQQGGAAIAAYRHHEAMRRFGIDSKMLVLNKMSNDPNVIEYRPSFFSKYIPKIYNRIISRTATYYASWSYSKYGCDFSNEESVRCADIIILHWVNRYTLSLRSIANILKSGKKVYWFMHDMWPITGGCHHALDCFKYQAHCEACPMSNNRHGTSKRHDLSWKQFEEKLRCLAPFANLHFFTPSHWLADRVKESSLFGTHKVTVVRNVLDTEIFKPVDKRDARNRLGLPFDKKLILFGADNISSPYKGWTLLRQALHLPIEGAEAVIYGNIPANLQSQIGIKLHLMGHINEVEQLVDMYSACDVFVSPSLADNYPNVLIEAMACGLPCVGTIVGGIPEIILNGVTGLLVQYDKPEALRSAITSVMENTEGKFGRSVIRNTIIKSNGYQNNLSKFL